MASREGRTEAPTEKRKRDARKKGNVAKSADLAPWLSLLAGTYVVPFTVAGVSRAVTGAFADVRRVGEGTDPAAAMRLLGTTLAAGFLAAAPLLLVCCLVSVAAQLAQTGMLVSPRLLRPDIKRINPLAGLKRLVSVRSLWDTVKQIAKSALVVAVTWPRIDALVGELTDRGRVPLLAGVATIGEHLLGMLRAVAWVMVIVGVVDHGFQRRQHAKDLKMTRQEIREEMRNAEGDPHVRQRIRSLQASMARRRMMSDVAGASVVVTNPTHVAVAIRYDAGAGGAPKVVASGADALAARIRERALEAGVPVVEAPPLARALWRTCVVGDEIPTVLYEAVAKVLVFVRRLRGGIAAASALPLPRSYQVDGALLEALPRRRGGRLVGATTSTP